MKCKTCNGVGMVGGPVGQTPANFDYVSEPCPDCTSPGAQSAEVFSDEQIASCFPSGGGMNEYGEVVVTTSWLNEFARAIQRAVLAQPSGVDDGL